MSRRLQDIKQEYINLALQIGDKKMMIYRAEREIRRVAARIDELDKEAVTLETIAANQASVTTPSTSQEQQLTAEESTPTLTKGAAV